MTYCSSPAPQFLSGRALFNGYPKHFVEIAIADNHLAIYAIADGINPNVPLCCFHSHNPARTITFNKRPVLAFESNVLPLPDHAYAAVVAFLKAHRAYSSSMTVGAAA